MIAFKDLRKIYTMGGEPLAALDGVSLSLERGAYLSVTGPSGSGKSTFMNVLGGLDRPTSGSYRFEGEDVSGLDDDQLAHFRNQRIGFVFQSFQLLARQTALQNVELPMIYAGLSPNERQDKAIQMLGKVGLSERIHHRPTQLSGGQQQRVAIARALANSPDLLLADEPTGALDSATGKDVLALFENLNIEGLTVIVVTHDASVAARAKRQIGFEDGRIVLDKVLRA
jgi:putative ABC transport system ATP-binding protein